MSGGRVLGADVMSGQLAMPGTQAPLEGGGSQPPIPLPGLPQGPPPPPAPPPAGGSAAAELKSALAAAGITVEGTKDIDEPDPGRASPKGSREHVFEAVSYQLAEWLERMPRILATAMKGGRQNRSPFAHAATGRQKYEIYKGMLFQPDGSVNIEGRQQMLATMTPQQYAKVVHIVVREMKKEGGGLNDDEPAVTATEAAGTGEY